MTVKVERSSGGYEYFVKYGDARTCAVDKVEGAWITHFRNVKETVDGVVYHYRVDWWCQ